MFSIFKLEMLLAARRGRYGALRGRYLKWMVFLLVIVIWRFAEESREHHRVWADFFIQLCLFQHFALVLLLTPAFLAGSIADERRQGTLGTVLTTRLSCGSIVFGKLFAGLVQVGSLLLTIAPIVTYCLGAGLLTPLIVLGLVVFTCVWLVTLGSLALCASVFCSSTSKAILVVYAVVALPVLAGWAFLQIALPLIEKWAVPPSLTLDSAYVVELYLRCFDPFPMLQFPWPAHVWVLRMGGFILLGSAVSAAALSLATAGLRARALPAQARRRKRARALFGRASLGDEPIVGRERITARPLFYGMVLLVTVATPFLLRWVLLDMARGDGIFLQGALGVLILSLFVGFRASGSITAEREQKTWESMLTTPLPTGTLVRQKARGALQGAYRLLAAFLIPSFLLAVPAGWPAFVFVVLFSYLGVRTMQFMAATGMEASARSSGSWRSLLSTVATGYGWVLLYVGVGGVLSLCVGWVILVFALLTTMPSTYVNWLIAPLFLILFTVALDLSLRRAATLGLQRATTWIDCHERGSSGKAGASSR